MVVGMASLLGLPSWGAAPTSAVPLVEISASSVREYYAERGDTAEAARIVGFAPAELEARVPLSRFVLTSLDPKPSLVCVRIVHANNLYRAEFSFRTPANAPSVRVRFESKYWDQLDDRLAGALAIRAFSTKHKQCDETGTLLPATWGESAANGSGYLLVNGGQADSVVVQVGGSPTDECIRLDDALKGRRITAAAFTHACPIVADNEKCRREVTVAVQRSFGPKLAEADRLRVRLPCLPRGNP